MNIFISWSGEKSKYFAEILRDWLPNVIQSLKPWISSSDIDKGVRWQLEVAQQLESTRFGIICLTPENMVSPWILFEAGALSKFLDSSYVCPILIELKQADIVGPLTQFQFTNLEQQDILSLLKSINKLLNQFSLTEEQLKESFQKWWPDLENKINSLSDFKMKSVQSRGDRELLEEILILARQTTKCPFASEQRFILGKMNYFLATLEDEREEWIIRNYYGLPGNEKGRTIKEMATFLKTTQKNIREMHATALQNIMLKIVSYLKETS